MADKEDAILQEIRDIKLTMKDFHEKITTIEVVLMGVNRENGLCTEVKEHSKAIEKLMAWKAQIIGGAAVITLIINYIIHKWF